MKRGSIGQNWPTISLITVLFLMTFKVADGDSGGRSCRCPREAGSGKVFKVVRAEAFLLVDAEGRSMGGLQSDGGESEIWLNDSRGTKRIQLHVSNIGSIQHLVFNDSSGNQRLYAALDRLGSPRLTMSGDADILGPGGSIRVKFDQPGVPVLRMFGPGKTPDDRGQLSVVVKEGCPPSVQALHHRTIVEDWPSQGASTP